MLSTRKVSGAAFGLIHIMVITAVCGSFTNAAAQEDVAGKAFKESALFRKREERAARDIEKYVEHLDKTARALNRLGRADGDDLRKRYESFSGEFEKLEKAQDRAVSSVDKMNAAGLEYFSSWEKANASIADPELRDEAARRRFSEMRKHIQLAEAIGDIGLLLQPFMSNLHDLRAFLGADLSPGNVRRAGESIQACQAEAKDLMTSIAEIQAAFKRLLNEMPG